MKILVRIGAIISIVGVWVAAQTAPQDNWTLDHYLADASAGGVTFSGVGGMAVAPDGKIIVADGSGSCIQVLNPDGTFVRKWGSAGNGDGQFSGPQGVAVTSDGKIIVANSMGGNIQVFLPDGTFVRKWGSYGSGDGQFSGSWGQSLAVDANGEIFVPDPGNSRVQVFAMDGIFLRKFGEPGTGPGQLSNTTGLALTPDGRVAVGASPYISFFTKQGQFIERAFGNELRAIGPDGLLYAKTGQVYSQDMFYMGTSANLTSITTLGDSMYNQAIAVDGRTGTIYIFNTNTRKIEAWRRGFRTLGGNPPNVVPMPGVRSVAQRTNGYIDVDYIVTDGDSATVSTAVGAFKGGSYLLRDMVGVSATALVEATASKIGSGIPTGQVHRITWDPAGANIPSGDLIFEVFVRDDRPKLLDVDFISLPTTPALTISRTSITHADMRAAWAWLVLNNEPGLSRSTDGEITGPTGVFTSSYNTGGTGLTAWVTRTTDAGRAWLFAKLGVREATSAEVAVARQATTTGTPNQFQVSRSQQMGSRPNRVNEWTFDATGTDGWWVVPSP